MLYECVWPIVEPDTIPVHDLRAEALDDLRETFAREHLTRRGQIMWEVRNGKSPALIATVPVSVDGPTSLPVRGERLWEAAA